MRQTLLLETAITIHPVTRRHAPEQVKQCTLRRITYSFCVSVALGIQHAMHMRRIMFPSLACPALQYFSINGMIFG